MKFISRYYLKLFRLEFRIGIILIILSGISKLHPENGRPFWDKWDSNIEMVLPSAQIDICLLQSTFRLIPDTETLECKPLVPVNFAMILSELLIAGEQLKEMKIVLLKKDRGNIYIKVRLEGKDYKFLSLLFNKNLSSYFLELKDPENKYYIFSLDPAKISFLLE